MSETQDNSEMRGTLIAVLVVAVLIAGIMTPLFMASWGAGCIAVAIFLLIYIGLLALFGHGAIIEMGLLVVILAVLVAILTPAIGAAKKRAKELEKSSQIQHRLVECNAPHPTAS